MSENAVGPESSLWKSKSSGSAATMLRSLSVVTELKVTGSTKSPTKLVDIESDLHKLALFGRIHSQPQTSKPLTTTQNSPRPLATYMVILDNYNDGLQRDSFHRKLEETVSRTHALWNEVPSGPFPKVVLLHKRLTVALDQEYPPANIEMPLF